jgi:hypothetical protein
MKTEQEIRKESNRPRSEDRAAIKVDQPKKKPRPGSDIDES